MAKVFHVKQEDLPDCWDDIEPLLRRVKDRFPQTDSMIDVFRKLLVRDYDCWAITPDDNDTYIMAVLIVAARRDGWCEVEYCAGENMSIWFEDALRAVEHYADRYKCEGVRMIGRKGWAPYLAENGYADNIVVYTKFLRGG